MKTKMEFPIFWRRAAAFGLAICLLASPISAGLAGAGLSIQTVSLFPTGSYPSGLVTGPQASTWLTLASSGKIGQFTPPATQTLHSLPDAAAHPYDLTIGNDGALWFTEQDAAKIGRLGQDGTVTEYPLPTPASRPAQVTLGQDGAVWFTEFDGNRVGRIDQNGKITETLLNNPNSKPLGITTALDGSIWFTEWNDYMLGTISLRGIQQEYPILNPPSRPTGITVGLDGNLWVIYEIGKIVTRVNPNTGEMANFTLATLNSSINDLAIGPDGKMWFIGIQMIGCFDVTADGPANLVEVSIGTPVFEGEGRSQIIAGPGDEVQFTIANQQALYKIPLGPAAYRDIQVFIKRLPSFLLAAGEFQLEADVVNWSSAQATGINLELTLDQNISYLSVSGDALSCTPTSGLVSCDLGSLNSGQTAAVVLTLKTSRIGTDKVNRMLTVNVNANEPDDLPANNTQVRIFDILTVFDYFNDFSSGADSYWSDSRIFDAGSRGKYLGIFDNDIVKLSFLKFPPHDRASVCFDLYILGKWDGSALIDPLDPSPKPPTIGPDLWSNYIDDRQILLSSFSNQARFNQSYPDKYPAGSNAAQSWALETGDLDGLGSQDDARYSMCYEITHTNFDFEAIFYGFNLDHLSGEGWALDNVHVKIFYNAAFDRIYLPALVR